MKCIALFCIFLQFHLCSIYAQEFIVTAKSGLSVRAKPDLESEKIGRLDYQTKVEIIETVFSPLEIVDHEKIIRGNWAKIKYKKTYGYVFDGYLAIQPDLDTGLTDFLNGERWYVLTKKDGEWIHSIPCDEVDPSFRIANGIFDQEIGQEFFSCKVLNINKKNSDVFEVRIQRCSYSDKSTFEIIDRNKKLIRWTTDGDSQYVIPQSQLKNYESIEEICE